jgi:hypothetical protein
MSKLDKIVTGWNNNLKSEVINYFFIFASCIIYVFLLQTY